MQNLLNHITVFSEPSPYYTGTTTIHEIGKISSISQRLIFGNNAQIYNRKFACILVLAPQRSGKSSQIKDWCVDIVNKTGRNIIVLDPKGEWKDALTEPNYDADKPECIDPSTVLVINKLAFKLSELDTDDLRELLKNPKELKSIDFLYEIIQKTKRLHNDDAEFFYKEILTKIPSKQNELYAFNEEFKEYGLHYNKPFMPAIISSMNNIRLILKHLYTEGKTYISPKELPKLFYKYKVLIFSNDIFSSTEQFYSGWITGKIMEIFQPYLKAIKPLVICEEASYLFSSNPNFYYKSTRMGQLYVTKEAKNDVACIFIGQTKYSINETLLTTFTAKILGALEQKDAQEDWRYCKWIKQNYDRKLWPFVYIDKLRGGQFYYYISNKARCLV